MEYFINKAIDDLLLEEQNWLNDFYAQSPDKIRSSEVLQLPDRGVTFRMRAQEKVIKALKSTHISYINTLWRKISESLDSCYYVYINWDSVDSWSDSMRVNNNQYRINVSHEDYMKAQKIYGSEYNECFLQVPFGSSAKISNC